MDKGKEKDLVCQGSAPNPTIGRLLADGEQLDQDQASPPPYPGRQEPFTPHPHYPPQPYHAQAPSRTLQVDFTSWRTTHLRVTEVGPAAAVLYTADIRMRKPHIIFKASSTENILGTVDLHYFRPRIELRIHGQAITLRLKNGFEQEITYESPALQNTSLTWRSKSASKIFDFECVDENSVPLAQFTAHSSWSMTEAGRIEIFGPRASNGILVDEIVVIGLALAQYTLVINTVLVSAVS